MTHLDFFAGIGGFSWGAKWAGIETIACVEINKFRQSELKKIHNEKTLIQKWATSEDYELLSVGRANDFADIEHIQNGDVVPKNWRKYIAAYGDAVLPVIAQYIFECIKLHKDG
jgi:site-specific DNA-cytosine methylase